MNEIAEDFRVFLDTVEPGVSVTFTKEEMLRLEACVRYTNNPLDAALLERLQVCLGYCV